MPSTGFTNGTTQTNDTLASTTWSNQANILDQDDDEVTEAITAKNTPGSGSTTLGWLKVGTFGFDSAIPSGSTISQVIIRVRSRVNSAGGIANREMAWAISGTRGTNVHGSATEPLTLETVDTDVTGERAWTRADLLNGTFEVHVRGRNGNSPTDPSYRFAYVAVNVTHEVAAVAAVRTFVLFGPAMRRASWW
jgi:hypothetical protein